MCTNAQCCAVVHAPCILHVQCAIFGKKIHAKFNILRALVSGSDLGVISGTGAVSTLIPSYRDMGVSFNRNIIDKIDT